MTIVPLLALLGASCWLIFRSLSLPRRLLASFLIPLSLSEPTFIDFGVFSELRNLYFGSKLASQGFQTSNVGTAECAERSAAHRRWCRACWTHHHTSGSMLDLGYIQALSYISYIFGLLPPLFFSPQEVAHSAGPTQKSSYGLLLGVFFAFFGLPKRCSKNALKKQGKKCENR